MAGLWLNLDTVTEGMVGLIVPGARNLSSIIETLQVDGDWLNAQIKALGLSAPAARKGREVAAPPAELTAFLRMAGVEEAVLAARPWPTLAEMRARYLRVVLAHAPGYLVAGTVLGRTAARLKVRARALGLPELTFQRKGTMRPAPPEWAALRARLCSLAVNFAEPVAFRAAMGYRICAEAGPASTTRWVFADGHLAAGHFANGHFGEGHHGNGKDGWHAMN
jgi:hypothetical protein